MTGTFHCIVILKLFEVACVNVLAISLVIYLLVTLCMVPFEFVYTDQ